MSAPPQRAAPQEASPDEEYQDCFSCRALGSVTFIGLGLYCFTIKEEDTRPSFNPKSRVGQAFLRYRGRVPAGMGLTFIALGLYRLVN